MKHLFICYPKCGTCKKAAQWLADNGVEVDVRDIVLQNPTANELKTWLAKSGKPVSKFFNTSGLRYRALNMKDKVKTLSEEELIQILSSEGMLVKRPLLIANDKILIGFKESEWRETIL